MELQRGAAPGLSSRSPSARSGTVFAIMVLAPHAEASSCTGGRRLKLIYPTASTTLLWSIASLAPNIPKQL